MGVMSMTDRLGWTTGPPAEREYAVDPVAEAMMIPSEGKFAEG